MIKHAFVSEKADGADATLVRPSNWNADHEGTATPVAHAAAHADGQPDEILGPLDPELYAKFLMGANVLHIGWVGWVTSLVNGSIVHSPSYQRASTSVTASSRGLAYGLIYGFNLGVTYSWRFNWDKKLYLIFNYSRLNPDAEASARFQLKEAITEGALAAKGIGIRLDNLALVGESYGTELGTVALGNIANTLDYQIVIIHDPSVPKIEWYLNGVLVGTQSTAARIPSGTAGGTSVLVHSIINGATGGVDAQSYLMLPKIWQAR